MICSGDREWSRFEYIKLENFNMNLSAPTTIVFLISVVIAIIGVLAGLGIFAIIPISAFWLVTIGYVVLAAGCLFKGI